MQGFCDMIPTECRHWKVFVKQSNLSWYVNHFQMPISLSSCLPVVFFCLGICDTPQSMDVFVLLPPWVSHSHHSPVCPRIYTFTAVSACACLEVSIHLSLPLSVSWFSFQVLPLFSFLSFLPSLLLLSYLSFSIYLCTRHLFLCQFQVLILATVLFPFLPTPPTLPLFFYVSSAQPFYIHSFSRWAVLNFMYHPLYIFNCISFFSPCVS